MWSVIGALSQAVSWPVETAVTCPLVRTHPAVIAQAAETSAAQLGGRFRLGVGTGEALIEHILGTVWPEAPVRLENEQLPGELPQVLLIPAYFAQAS